MPNIKSNNEGFFLLHKPINLTSAQFLNRLKQQIKSSDPHSKKIKIGHGGTLDKFASGLIMVAVGREYTKQLGTILKNSDKTYTAEIILGATSTTDDPEGKIKLNFKTKDKLPNKTEIKSALDSFPLNTFFKQKTPVYSAKKIKGIRQSDLARQAKTFTPKTNLVAIKNLTLLNFNKNQRLSPDYPALPVIKIYLTVSSGFYVRAFTRDLGQKLNCGAFLLSLTRTHIDLPPQIKNNLRSSINLSG